MAITGTDVTNAAPELASVDAGRLAWAVNLANAKYAQLSDTKRELARTLYAAHLLSITGPGGGANGGGGKGPISSESMGGISISYASSSSGGGSSSGSDRFSSTPYGRELKGILRSRLSARVV